jgi:hypothetical protein
MYQHMPCIFCERNAAVLDGVRAGAGHVDTGHLWRGNVFCWLASVPAVPCLMRLGLCVCICLMVGVGMPWVGLGLLELN